NRSTVPCRCCWPSGLSSPRRSGATIRGARNRPPTKSLQEIVMSRLFGPLRQMGYVVTDVDAAMRHWIEVCGVGPWFYADRLPLTAFTYGGQRYDDIHVS